MSDTRQTVKAARQELLDQWEGMDGKMRDNSADIAAFEAAVRADERRETLAWVNDQ